MEGSDQPFLVAFAGLPGAGKTTLAHAVAALARQTSIDVRHALFAPCDWADDEKLTAHEAMLDATVHHLERSR